MVFNFNGNLFNPAKVMSVTITKGQSATHPFNLTIWMENDRSHTFSYVTDEDRRRDVNKFHQLCNSHAPAPVTKPDVEAIVSTATTKIKNDLAKIRKMLREGEPECQKI